MELVGERYALERELGAGATGEAWLARHVATGQTVVLKLLHKKHATSAKHFERFRREVIALARLDHPNVVQILDCGRCERRGQPFFAMVYSPGTPLGAVLRAEGRLGLRRALRLADQLLQALEHAHELGIVHRDLKPDNLLIERPGAPDERLRILDFGLAKHLRGGAQTRAELTAGNVVGTPLYLAPEQCQARPVTPATDMYAVGCLLMVMLTGAPAFEGSVLEVLRQHVLEPPPRLLDRAPGLTPALDEVVARCLRKRGAERPAAAAVRAVLLEAARSLEPPPADSGSTVDLAGTTVDVGGVIIPLPDAGATLDFAGQVLPLPGRATERDGGAAAPLPDTGPAHRWRIDLLGPATGRMFLFVGARLRFGRDRGGGCPGDNDLVIRAFPRAHEHANATAERTRRLSGRHGSFIVTTGWVGVEDLGSSHGSAVDGAPLAAGALTLLPSSFRLVLAGSVELAGQLLPPASGRRDAHPVGVLRLRRVGEAPDVLYALAVGPFTLGTDERDGLCLRAPGVLPGHALLVPAGRRLLVGPARPDAALRLDGRSVAPGQLAPIDSGARVSLGRLELAFGQASDEDMKPS